MDISYRSATERDLELLVESRLTFVEMTKEDDAYGLVRENTRAYFHDAIKEGQCDIILAEHMDVVVGTGIVFYYSSVPSKYNPWGKNAYITSMYVDAAYRRRGIAGEILTRLLSLAKEKGCHVFMLQESEMGRPLYEKFGFRKGKPGMILKTKT